MSWKTRKSRQFYRSKSTDPWPITDPEENRKEGTQEAGGSVAGFGFDAAGGGYVVQK
jgi:hypothetical protein